MLNMIMEDLHYESYLSWAEKVDPNTKSYPLYGEV